MFLIQKNKTLFVTTVSLLFTVVLLITGSSPFAAANEEIERPSLPELITTVEKMKKLKPRSARVKLLVDFAEVIREKVKTLPEEIEDSEIPKVEHLFELDLFLTGLSSDSLSSRNCPRTKITIDSLVDPNGDGIDLNSAGEVVRELIRSACRS